MHVNNILLTVVDTGRRSGAAREKHHGRMIDMATEKNIKDLFNATAYDRNGDKLGAVKEVFVDDNSGQPTFVEVGHGLFGMSSSLVPMRGHRLSGDQLQLAFDKDRIKDAPNLDADNHLTPEDQRNIYGHYQLTDAQDSERYLADERRERHADPHHDGRRDGDRGQTRPGQVHDRPDHVDSDLTPEELKRRAALRDDADLRDADRAAALDGQAPRDDDRHGHVGHPDDVDRHDVSDLGGHDAAGRDRDASAGHGADRDSGLGEVRLRRHVVTDYETIEVPVTREEIRVERDTISDRDAHDAGHGSRDARDLR